MTNNRVYEAFDRVHAGQELKSGTLDFLREQRAARAPRAARPAVWARPLAAVCAALVLALGIGGWHTLAAPVSYISVDAGASVELALDRFDRIVSVTAYGGAPELEGLALEGRSYAEGIEALLGSDALEPYLEDGGAVFTVAADTQTRESALLSGIESCAGYAAYGGRSYCAGTDAVEQAHSCGMSLGKYAAYLALAECDDTVTPEDCQDMTMAELHSAIESHRHGEEHPSWTGNGAGNGTGNAGGNGAGNGAASGSGNASGGGADNSGAGNSGGSSGGADNSGSVSSGSGSSGSGSGSSGGHHGEQHHGGHD